MPDESGIFRVLVDPREDMASLLSGLAKRVHNLETDGVIVIEIVRDGRRHKYAMHLGGFAANNPTYAHGALDACSMLTRELALQEVGIL